MYDKYPLFHHTLHRLPYFITNISNQVKLCVIRHEDKNELINKIFIYLFTALFKFGIHLGKTLTKLFQKLVAENKIIPKMKSRYELLTLTEKYYKNRNLIQVRERKEKRFSLCQKPSNIFSLDLKYRNEAANSASDYEWF